LGLLQLGDTHTLVPRGDTCFLHGSEGHFDILGQLVQILFIWLVHRLNRFRSGILILNILFRILNILIPWRCDEL